MKTLIQLLSFTLTIFFFLNSYQTKAQCHLDDWTALKALYESTDGDNWLYNTGWGAVKMEKPPKNCNLGNLYRVQIDRNGRVAQLNLFNNNLNGKIPSELGKLEQLEVLSLSTNNLSGSIPQELGQLANLRAIILYENQLQGNIPSELGNLNKLVEINLQNNNLTGSIPAELGNLNINKLSGSIPPELGKLRNLTELDLDRNNLTDSIPPELSSLGKLVRLSLFGNQLSGNISPELENLNNLVWLLLQNNQLSGNIPIGLGNLTDLNYVLLQNNQLSGSIPHELSSNFIYDFNISSNFFSCSDLENHDIKFYSPQNYLHNGEKSFSFNNAFKSISLSAPFNQAGIFSYQWYKNNRLIKGATNTVLHLGTIEFEDVGNYTLHVIDDSCLENGVTFISEPISVSRINPIKIRTVNENVLSDAQITFDIVIDSLGQDYSADGLTLTLETRGNYTIESVQVINPILSVVEVDLNKLSKNTLSINRINSQLLAGNAPILKATASLAITDISAIELTCSHFVIAGGTQLSSGLFIDFDDVYIDLSINNLLSNNNNGEEVENLLPLVLTISSQNCNTGILGLAEIKILEEGKSPFAYNLKDEQGSTFFEATSNEKQIELPGLNAGNYELTVFDMEGKKTTMKTCIPLINNLGGNGTCNTNCLDYLIVPPGNITGTHAAKKEIDIRGFVGKNEFVEFWICD